MSDTLGYEQGEVCNRNGCVGVIDEVEQEGCCSCHINPPCSYCTDKEYTCPVCGWESNNVEDMAVHSKNQSQIPFKRKTVADLDGTKIDWIVESHTHFSQKCIGVYPEGTSRKEVVEKVKGSFGGRFTRFGNGQFEYIAYTD